jgi:hypothetical protein
MLQPEAGARAEPPASMRELIRFEGAVLCRSGAGAVRLSLRGRVPGPAARGAEVLFSGVMGRVQALPERLHDVRVLELEHVVEREQRRHFRIEAREGRFDLVARGAQRHCDEVGAAFFAALPRPRVPRLLRWGWSTLLALLRLGPLARLIARRGD